MLDEFVKNIRSEQTVLSKDIKEKAKKISAIETKIIKFNQA